MTAHEGLVFGGFLILIIVLLIIDIGVLNKKDTEVSFKHALLYTIIWVSLALGFWALIHFFGDEIHGPENLDQLQALVTKYSHPIVLTNDFEESLQLYRSNLGLEFITGYIIEYSLSVDNVFVFLMIFFSFGVKKIYYHRILFWGILGAIIFRFLFIFISSALIQQFEWILYLFGALLVFTGIKMFIERNHHGQIDTKHHPVIRFVSRFFKVDREYEGRKFFIRKNGKLYVTSMFIVLMVIEFSDVIFAVDSVPAIFAVTKDPFMVYFSNIFAIIGLRSLFFLIMNVVNKFRFLKIGLSALLVFIGLKMLVHHYIEITTVQSLLVILSILVISVIASLIIPEKKQAA
ncbi:MAG TPA: TerC/Alx family metal homeostasis membrane protein [Bacteroidales bacterium]